MWLHHLRIAENSKLREIPLFLRLHMFHANCPMRAQFLVLAYVEYTHMMLDAILQICRICGNQPRPGKDISECSPILSDASLMSGKVDPFSILPAESSPRVHALMHHCKNTFIPQYDIVQKLC
jgi:hypothetical protein